MLCSTVFNEKLRSQVRLMIPAYFAEKQSTIGGAALIASLILRDSVSAKKSFMSRRFDEQRASSHVVSAGCFEDFVQILLVVALIFRPCCLGHFSMTWTNIEKVHY